MDDAALNELAAAQNRIQEGEEAVIGGYWNLANGERAEVELRVGAAADGEAPGYLAAIHDLTDRVRRMGEQWRRTFDAMMDGVALVDHTGAITLANHALEPHRGMVEEELQKRLRGEAPRHWRRSSAGRLLECSLSLPEGLEHAIWWCGT